MGGGNDDNILINLGDIALAIDYLNELEMEKESAEKTDNTEQTTSIEQENNLGTDYDGYDDYQDDYEQDDMDYMEFEIDMDELGAYDDDEYDEHLDDEYDEYDEYLGDEYLGDEYEGNIEDSIEQVELEEDTDYDIDTNEKQEATIVDSRIAEKELEIQERIKELERLEREKIEQLRQLDLKAMEKEQQLVKKMEVESINDRVKDIKDDTDENVVKTTNKVENNKEMSKQERITMYSSMETEVLYQKVRQFMQKRDISRGIIDKKILKEEFGTQNIRKLILKSYLISIGKGVTMGK